MMNDSGDMREDLKVPEPGPLRTEIETKFEGGEQFMVTVLKSMDDEAVIATKNITK